MGTIESGTETETSLIQFGGVGVNRGDRDLKKKTSNIFKEKQKQRNKRKKLKITGTKQQQTTRKSGRHLHHHPHLQSVLKPGNLFQPNREQEQDHNLKTSTRN